MSNEGLVSVVIPNYNHGKFLDQRIQSVLAQSYERLEIVLLDDGSSDDSVDVIEKYRNHPKVSHVVINEQNSGSPFKQWTAGISLAKGEFVWIAESDDWCEPTLLQYLLEGIQQDSDCVISYCQSYCVTGNEIKWQSSHRQLSEIVKGNEFIRKYLCPNPAIVNVSMAIWRRKNFALIPRDFLNYRFSGDWVFWIELAKTGNVCINGRLLNYFRKHEADVSTGAYASGLNFVEGLSILDNMFKNQLIGKKAYEHAYKKNFREFRSVADEISDPVRTQVINRFRNPLTSRKLFYKIWLSAVWRAMKGRK
ncbi:glycosyltransferase family 2 protein [Parapedobacter deserti]|uniref:Glycosyltransferase family 2 protein n=1 Tax=Parapedobacter deserti TaxID=1912957 RepID=A0ABV7JKH5_9SPHI